LQSVFNYLQVKATEQQVLADAEKTTEKYGLEAGLYKVGVQLSTAPAQVCSRQLAA
jgi:hypothetical protein